MARKKLLQVTLTIGIACVVFIALALPIIRGAFNNHPLNKYVAHIYTNLWIFAHLVIFLLGICLLLWFAMILGWIIRKWHRD